MAQHSRRSPIPPFLPDTLTGHASAGALRSGQSSPHLMDIPPAGPSMTAVVLPLERGDSACEEVFGHRCRLKDGERNRAEP
jgi:hypothetical protein